MRGKLGGAAGERPGVDHASMRPAHYAREVAHAPSDPLGESLASMRPAHYAREVTRAQAAPARAQTASMRPAHYAREVRRRGTCRPARAPRFNEARALCAGSYRRRRQAGRDGRRFNEARALCAGSLGTDNNRSDDHDQASMRPAHYAREVANRSPKPQP